jgi:hypothetical protein
LTYFIHGLTQVISQFFHIGTCTNCSSFDAQSEIELQSAKG